ncbi:MAG: hypothetical protein JXR25_11790 [Pontiellaceae bacterium]|nr:hypothetical protein [Pontiellaceae bacterium]MBN2785497.1 hypothetical protein [Pontiellaceae bacterium]
MDTPKKKKRFFLNHKKSSAFVVSMAIHAALILIALTFVAVKVYIPAETNFEIKEVKRPRMNLRKLQVPVKERKKTQAPKLRQNIVSPKISNVSITMPEIVGVPGGMGAGTGTDLGGLWFGMDLFGGNRGTGNEFIGTFYDLKQEKDGKLAEIGELLEKHADDPGFAFSNEAQSLTCKIVKGFVSSGFNENRLKKYFQAPKQKFATSFMMPRMSANAAPEAFGVADQVKPSFWVCHYKGQMAAPESGRYRFCGFGDDILIVRAGRKVVLDACWPELIGQMTSWKSDDPNSRVFPIDTPGIQGQNFRDLFEQIDDAGGYDGTNIRQWSSARSQIKVNGEPFQGYYTEMASRMVIGDWMDLKKGQLVDVDILTGEVPGGEFTCRLMMEKEGAYYKTVISDAGARKVLPAFMTASVDPKLVEKMKIDPQQVTLDAPLFGAKINSGK